MKYLSYIVVHMSMMFIVLPSMQAVSDYQSSERICKQLVDRAVTFFRQHSLAESCHAFTHDVIWRYGDMRIFVWDEEGHWLTHGDQYDHIWDICDHCRHDEAASVWKTVMLNNSEMHVYTKNVVLEGVPYTIGAGFYLDSYEKKVIKLVKDVVDSMAKRGVEDTLALVSNKNGIFVHGPLYAFVVDQNDILRAHGSEPVLIGQSIFDATWGIPVEATKATTHFLKSSMPQRWITFPWKGASKKIFGKKYRDAATGFTYVVFAGYPDIGIESIAPFVKRAIAYIKTEGHAAAYSEFNKVAGVFNFANELKVFVYASDGTVLANGESPLIVGHNMMSAIDELGNHFVKDLISQVLEFGYAWTMQFSKNAYRIVYAEKMVTPTGDTVIVGAGYWAGSLRQVAEGMMEQAQFALEFGGRNKALRRFVGKSIEFLQGPVFVSVYDIANRICFAKGHYHKEAIWQPFNYIDPQGQRIMSKLSDVATRGGGWVSFKENNATYHTYVRQQVTPENDNLMIMVGYHS